MISRGKSLKNNVVHLIISVIQVMNSLETTEEALQSISIVWAKWLKNSCVDGQKRSQKVSVYESVNEHTHLDNSKKNMLPELEKLIKNT
ncbi:hypothetical protein BpHYR1_037541 [Brachionus plicatilis]|uniref:Uncharacterized protein n=1 Tax=Brachionus plicatilis TaxID=10195 RepID=A0A3M7RZE7_BRAPC|nr:hypothetical protein BpHYR1_037541 [Brachionus plicatilis]